MICCAYVPNTELAASHVGLRRDLAARVPRYMLPARWKTFDQLPKNANGKIDRARIREIFKCDRRTDQQTAAQKSTSN